MANKAESGAYPALRFVEFGVAGMRGEVLP